MSSTSIKHLLGILALTPALAGAQAPAAVPAAAVPAEQAPAQPAAPVSSDTMTFEQLGHTANIQLSGVHNAQTITFMMPRDRIATAATLDLAYTPSPSLLPTLSHLRVLLNDEMMAVLPIAPEQAGKTVRQQVALDPRHIADFNRVRIEFVGHYTDVCEDPAHSSLWLDISRQSSITLDRQALDVKHDLSAFPAPFFDARSHQALTLPFVFADVPEAGQQRAAGILASYFGSQAGWRGARFPVELGALPERNAVVFATNDARPDFLKERPPVQGPVVEMASHPDNPYVKLLIVLGRDDNDLVQAATALAAGSPLLRGDSVAIGQVQALAPRVPYDAPNWTRTDRPVRFDELVDHPEQLQVSGLRPPSIELAVNVPPDLFIWRNQGIPMRVKYRYTPPPTKDESRLNIGVNSQFIASYPLWSLDQASDLHKLRLPLVGENEANPAESLSIPALKVGTRSTLRFDFSFASTVGSAQRDTCQTMLPVDVRAAVDGDSTLDFSGYHHYLAMPDLRAFINTGFPFSRMADLSQTVVVMPAKPSAAQLGTLLDALAGLGAQTGYPGFGVTITDDWDTASKADADLLVIGQVPESLREHPDTHVVLDTAQSWMRQSRSPGSLAPHDTTAAADPAAVPTMSVNIASAAPIAAFAGMQSPFHEQRSIVSLLANTAGDFELLRDAMADSGKRAVIAGSVSVVREAGIFSEQVGKTYFVGSLPWWVLLWFHLSESPLLLAGSSALVVLLGAVLLWHVLRQVARRRLKNGGSH